MTSKEFLHKERAIAREYLRGMLTKPEFDYKIIELRQTYLAQYRRDY